MWIITACQHISPDTTIKGLKTGCISNAMDGTNGVMLCNDSEENGNVRSACQEEEGTDCEDGDSDTNW
jgi:hypothetical protein